MTILPGQSVVYTGSSDGSGLSLGDTGQVLDIDFTNHTASVLWTSGSMTRQACAVYDYYLAPGEQEQALPSRQAAYYQSDPHDLLADSMEGAEVPGISVRASYDSGGAEATVGQLYNLGGAQVIAARVEGAVEQAVASLRADHGVVAALEGLDDTEIDDVVRHASLEALSVYLEDERGTHD